MQLKGFGALVGWESLAKVLGAPTPTLVLVLHRVALPLPYFLLMLEAWSWSERTVA